MKRGLIIVECHCSGEGRNQEAIEFFFSKWPQIKYAYREFVELQPGPNSNSNISLKRFHHSCYLKFRTYSLPNTLKTMALQGRRDS